MDPILVRHFPDPTKLREVVAENFCLCDVRMYVKAKNGIVTWPRDLAGRTLPSILGDIKKGVILRASKGEEEHIFVVGLNAYQRKLEAAGPQFVPVTA